MMLKWFKSHDFYRHFLCLFLLQIRFFFFISSLLWYNKHIISTFFTVFFLFVRFSSICVACGRFIFTSIQPIPAKCDTPNIRHFPTVASKRHPRTNVVDATQQIERLWFISNFFFFVSCDSCVRSTSNTQTYSISFRVLRMKRTQSKPVATYISHEGLASIDIESFISFRSFFFYFPFFVRRCSLSNVVESERQSMDHQ